ncbi:MAG: Mov34/MPN/PAD-1 family protein [Candidatus Saganbacteria bacterium]|nr:Mov34/MPN/PAD-1 family protein [Candidatus Saganbacteria bacterium]
MFVITQHQYDIIMHQSHACYPQESGGFLGGDENKITGVLPVPSKVVGKTDEFALWDDDFGRGYLFFDKHKLKLLGVYHTHPDGVAYPSEQDIKASMQKGLKFIFVIGLKDRNNPDLRAYTVAGGVVEVPIQVVSNSGVVSLDLFSSKDRKIMLTPEVLHDFHDYMKKVIREETSSGQKMDFGWDSSSFTTMA